MLNLNKLRLEKSITIKSFGNSMKPFLIDGDIITIKKVNFSKIQVDDIICFSRRNKLITHRVIYKEGNWVTTKGDNNLVADLKVHRQHIIGVVTGIKRNNESVSPDEFYLLQSSIYLDEIKTISRIFREHNIDFVVLKGLPLYLMIEKKHPRHIYSDCDILVSKSSVQKAIKILRREEYKRLDTSLTDTHSKISTKLVEESFIKFVSGCPVVFDLHYEAAFLMVQIGKLGYLYPQQLVDKFSEDLLLNKREISIGGIKIPMLGVEHQITYLLLHLFHHNFKGSFRYDVLSKVLQLSFNDQKFLSIISEYKFSNFAYASFSLILKYYPNQNVADLLKAINIKKSTKKFIKKEILNIHIFDDEERVVAGIARFRSLFMLSQESLPRKMLIFLNVQVLYSIWWVVVLYVKSNAKHFIAHR